MNSTKNKTNTKTTGTKTTKGCGGKCKTSNTKKNSKATKSSDQESDTDPSGSYTGNPVGWGKYADPVQDADDL